MVTFFRMFNYSIKRNSLKTYSRAFSQALTREKHEEHLKMQAWQVHNYEEDLQLSSTHIPIIRGPEELLIKVDAASVNPIDLYMKDGYASNLLNVFRMWEMELPLTLGRDFSGTLVGKGALIGDKYKIGDKVYGFVPLHKPGSFAEYVLAEKKHVRKQPEKLKSTESASLVYAAMTAWSALFITGGLQYQDKKNKISVLILGASGGVGTMAVQLLKSQGVKNVTGVCASDAVPLLKELGCDNVINYQEKDYSKQISESRFDIVLDCVKLGIEKAPSEWKFKQFISLNSPLMTNMSQHGLIAGFLKSGATLLNNNISNIKDGKIAKWGFFVPCEKGFGLIDNLVKNEEIKPIIHKEFNYEELPKAFEEVKKGHLRGKVVIKIC